MTLREGLGLGRREMVALIGAGGKTTTLLRLAKEYGEDGRKVLVTTTTKIFKPTKPHVRRLFLARDVDALLDAVRKLREPVIVGAGSGLEKTGKLVGFLPAWLDRLAAAELFDAILVEADGAAMRPFKVPADHEPVIPESSSVAVWIMGIKVLGRPLSADWVHRFERAALLLGVSPGVAVTDDLIVELVEHPQGCLKGIPPRSRKVALINQADHPKEVKLARDLASRLVHKGIERAVVTSYLSGEVVKEVITA